MTPGLKPCPFCGETEINAVVEHRTIVGTYSSITIEIEEVECWGCGANTYGHGRGAAIAKWNLRKRKVR